MPKERVVLGADIGGTKFTVALADDRGEILSMSRGRTPAEKGGVAVAETAIEESRKLLQKVGADRPKAIGIGFGGPVDPWKGTIRKSHHVRGWEGVRLADLFSEAFEGTPARLDNDANAGALGEAVFGAGRGAKVMLYINIGTGIGGAIFREGKVEHGAHGIAGEIGHTVVWPGGPTCTCGRRGCLEAVCSGLSIARRGKEAAQREGGALQELLGGGEEVTCEAVFRAAERGDKVAIKVVEETVHYLCLGIGNAVTLLDPDLIVLGGGVANEKKLLVEPVAEKIDHYVLPVMRGMARVVGAELGYDAGIKGAVALALKVLRGED